MKHFVNAALLWVLLALPSHADERIESVISSQIDAFLADDFETAFTFASPMIKDIFGTADRFGAMVRNGYPMVWRPSKVEFLSIEEGRQGVIQKVLVHDAKGAAFVLEYEMIRDGEGWLINGVRVQKADEGLAAVSTPFAKPYWMHSDGSRRLVAMTTRVV